MQAGITRKTSTVNPRFNDVSIPANHLLCMEGDEAENLYVVSKGKLEVFKEEGRPIAILSKGEAFGEQAVLHGGRRGASVRAIDDSVCLEISGSALRGALDNQPPFTQVVLNGLLLQLALSNELRQVDSTPDSVVSSLINLRLSDMTAGKSRSEIQTMIKSSEHNFSAVESLYLRIVAADGLKTILLNSMDDIIRERQKGNGLVITRGSLLMNTAFQGKVSFGPGSAFGIAEVIAEKAFTQTFEMKASMNALTIPGPRARAHIQSLNKGLRGVFRAVVMRTLNLDHTPDIFAD